MFINREGGFNKVCKTGQPWKIDFIKFCFRVISSFPRDPLGCSEQLTKLQLIELNMKYVINYVQPFFSKKRFNVNDRVNEQDNVSSYKLIRLWITERKKAIEIIKNDNKWPVKVHAEIDKQKTERYYEFGDKNLLYALRFHLILSSLHGNLLQQPTDE